MRVGRIIAATALGLLMTAGLGAAQADTLTDVKARGVIKCGLPTQSPGYAFLTDQGKWTGYDVEFCRAAAAAVFGDGEKVQYVPLQFSQAFTALQSREVDILSRSVTMTISRDTQLGFNFIGPNMYTGQGFMVHKSLNVGSVKQLDGATICVLAGTVTERYLSDYFKANNLKYTPVAIESGEQAFAAYENQRCDAITMEPPLMAVNRIRFKDPSAHIILPDLIAKSYEAPVVREGDDKWYGILQWTYFAEITAEEYGITQENVDAIAKSTADPEIRRFLGLEDTIGEKMGLPNDWVVKVVKAVGNFGEVYDRNVGKNSPLNLPRGMNALWRDGGVLFAPSWK
jgi:general L-amino acid transport system substrate-binding protein